MTAAEIGDLVLQKYNFMFRNNRGIFKRGNRYIRAGIPEPQPKKHKNDLGEIVYTEPDDAMKGGDYIGFVDTEITPDMVGKKIAVFCNIEVKATGDRLKKGQIRWHNFILNHGGISQIWAEKKGKIEVTSREIK